MFKELESKVQSAVKDFISSLERIDKEASEKMKEYEKGMLDNLAKEKLISEAEKENQKKISDAKAKLAEDAKKQESVYQEITKELAKQAVITKDIASKNEKMDGMIKARLAELQKASAETEKAKSVKEENEALSKELKEKQGLADKAIFDYTEKLRKLESREKEIAIISEKLNERDESLDDRELKIKKSEKVSGREEKKKKLKE